MRVGLSSLFHGHLPQNKLLSIRNGFVRSFRLLQSSFSVRTFLQSSMIYSPDYGSSRPTQPKLNSVSFIFLEFKDSNLKPFLFSALRSLFFFKYLTIIKNKRNMVLKIWWFHCKIIRHFWKIVCSMFPQQLRNIFALSVTKVAGQAGFADKILAISCCGGMGIAFSFVATPEPTSFQRVAPHSWSQRWFQLNLEGHETKRRDTTVRKRFSGRRQQGRCVLGWAWKKVGMKVSSLHYANV